jgi:Asp-tRNA(Asn)/Glu-tRNA(Gln) amidotransferase A subunit family amidase
MSAGDLPQDATLDRRAFLLRMAALSVAGPSALGFLPVGEGPAPATPLLPADALDAARSAFDAARDRGLQRWISRSVRDGEDELTVAEALALMNQGRLHPRALVEAYLDRIRRLDGVYRAWNVVLDSEALGVADRVAGWSPGSGPLHGIPLAVKDNYYVGGVLTTANSHIFREFRPGWDSTAVARLRAAGGIVLGKTQMGPLATTRATTPEGRSTTVNAWTPGHPEVSPGGSSTGSATAVAARMAGSSIGTQTGGSITAPALAQGLTGIKPTMGRVSLHGVIPLTYTRDHPGPIARDALDAALLLQVLAGPDPADPRTLGLPPVPDYIRAAEPVTRDGRPAVRWPTTLGILPGYLSGPVLEPGTEPEEGGAAERRRRRLEEEAARRVMVRALEGVGVRVVELTYPEEWDVLTSGPLNNVRLPERSEPFLTWLRTDVRLFGNSLSPWINGLLLSGDEYLRGQRAKARLLEIVLEHVFSRCDVVVQTSPIPFDMIGLPLVAFPIGFDETSGPARPLGAMLGAPPFGEERLLAVAAAYQSVTDWHRRRPPDPDPVLVGSRPVGPRAWWEADPADEEGSDRRDAREGAAVPRRVRIDAGQVMEFSQ